LAEGTSLAEAARCGLLSKAGRRLSEAGGGRGTESRCRRPERASRGLRRSKRSRRRWLRSERVGRLSEAARRGRLSEAAGLLLAEAAGGLLPERRRTRSTKSRRCGGTKRSLSRCSKRLGSLTERVCLLLLTAEWRCCRGAKAGRSLRRRTEACSTCRGSETTCLLTKATSWCCTEPCGFLLIKCSEAARLLRRGPKLRLRGAKPRSGTKAACRAPKSRGLNRHMQSCA
jgi:hypothetical protein